MVNVMRKVKKRKLSVKKILRLVIPLILILIIFFERTNIINFYQSKKTGYPFETIKVLHELNIYDDIKKHPYSNTLDKIVDTKYYNKKYLKEYLDIEYHDNKSFLSDINNLLILGYDSDDINAIYNKLSPESIKVLEENDYLKDIINILKLNYFHEEKLERYIKYSKDKEIEYEDIITLVNAELDHDYYTNVINIEKPEEITVLVNKYHKLDNDYVPSDLESITPKYNRGNNNMMRHEARVNFEEMCEAALNEGIHIYSGSAYRSYSYQLNLYNRYVSNNGFANAETFSARAGYSEHQTGLATDILNGNIDYISSSDKEYEWLINNSYKYGFILRYPKDKENITGYMYEEWHFRYFGKDIAEDLHKTGITYEEYVARK